MPEVSGIEKAPDGRFYITIKRHNGTSYRALCEDRKSIEEYKAELLQNIKQRGR